MKALGLKARWLSVGVIVGSTVIALWAQEAQQVNRGINVLQGNVTTSRGYVFSGASPVHDFRTNTSITTDGAATWTAAQLLSGYVTRTAGATLNTATDTLPTAANLAAAIPGVIAGMTFFTVVDMTATPSLSLTLNGASTGVTYTGGCGTAISTSDVMLLMVNFTSATAYRAVCLNVNT